MVGSSIKVNTTDTETNEICFPAKTLLIDAKIALEPNINFGLRLDSVVIKSSFNFLLINR